MREGERPGNALLILSGWACCQKTLVDGRRQITAIALPGDFVGLHLTALDRMDHSISALSPITYAEVPQSWIDSASCERPRIADLLEREIIVEMAIQREWSLNIGQRSAVERVAHLLCELHARMEAAGRVFNTTCEFPITQSDIADATGLTPVYINRTLKELGARNLALLKDRQLEVLDLQGLHRVAMFSPAYLHFNPVRGDHEKNTREPLWRRSVQ